MFGIIGSEARRFSGRFPWDGILTLAFVLIVLAALAYGAKTLYSSLTGGESAAPAQVEQPVDPSTSLRAQGKPVQPAPVVAAPTVPTWPVVKVDGKWVYTHNDVPTPPGIDPVYSGAMEDILKSGIDLYTAKMAIVRRIIPESMINGDAVGLTIVRNPDNLNIRVAAITIARGTAEMQRLSAQRKYKEAGEVPLFDESHFYLTTDAEKSWVEVDITGSRDKADIDRVRVSGTSVLLLSFQGGSNHFYWQAEYTP
jgi:hypothetical protein